MQKGFLFNLRNRLRAIGLIEMMLVMAVIAVIAVVTAQYYNSTRNAARVNRVISDIKVIHDAVKTWAETNSDWTIPLTLNTLVTDKLLPAQYLTTQGELWGATYTLEKAVISGQTVGSIKLTMMEKAYCTAILKKLSPVMQCGCFDVAFGYQYFLARVYLDSL